MQSVKWIGFGTANSVSQTMVHFFPVGKGISAPYPANCTVNVFGPLKGAGQGVQRKRVTLDGARLSQPDGVFLNQAFEDLEQEGFFGVSVELSTVQPRIDLSTSSCVIEFCSRAGSVKYWPKLPPGRGEENSQATALVLNDNLTSTSVVVVNCREESFSPSLSVNVGERTPLDLSGRYQVEAESVAEISITEIISAQKTGVNEAAGFSIEAYPADVAVFTVYRDYNTRKPISVSAL